MKHALFHLVLTALIIPVVWGLLWIMGNAGMYNPSQTPRAITIIALTLPAIVILYTGAAALRSALRRPANTIRILNIITLTLALLAALTLIYAAY